MQAIANKRTNFNVPIPASQPTTNPITQKIAMHIKIRFFSAARVAHSTLDIIRLKCDIPFTFPPNNPFYDGKFEQS
jgi:hypothetical protein